MDPKGKHTIKPNEKSVTAEFLGNFMMGFSAATGQVDALFAQDLSAGGNHQLAASALKEYETLTDSGVPALSSAPNVTGLINDPTTEPEHESVNTIPQTQSASDISEETIRGLEISTIVEAAILMILTIVVVIMKCILRRKKHISKKSEVASPKRVAKMEKLWERFEFPNIDRPEIADKLNAYRIEPNPEEVLMVREGKPMGIHHIGEASNLSPKVFKLHPKDTSKEADSCFSNKRFRQNSEHEARVLSMVGHRNLLAMTENGHCKTMGRSYMMFENYHDVYKINMTDFDPNDKKRFRELKVFIYQALSVLHHLHSYDIVHGKIDEHSFVLKRDPEKSKGTGRYKDETGIWGNIKLRNLGQGFFDHFYTTDNPEQASDRIFSQDGREREATVRRFMKAGNLIPWVNKKLHRHINLKKKDAYVMPKRCLDKEKTTAIDILALGQLLYKMTNYGEEVGYITEEVETDDGREFVETPSWKNKKVPEDLRDFINKMLDNDPKKRFSAVKLFEEEFMKDIMANDVPKCDDKSPVTKHHITSVREFKVDVKDAPLKDAKLALLFAARQLRNEDKLRDLENWFSAMDVYGVGYLLEEDISDFIQKLEGQEESEVELYKSLASHLMSFSFHKTEGCYAGEGRVINIDEFCAAYIYSHPGDYEEDIKNVVYPQRQMLGKLYKDGEEATSSLGIGFAKLLGNNRVNFRDMEQDEFTKYMRFELSESEKPKRKRDYSRLAKIFKRQPSDNIYEELH